MSRQQFGTNNSAVEIFTFQKSGATASFDPTINFPSSKRVSWRLNDGLQTTQVAGNSLVYTGFTSDNAIRDIEIRANSFKGIAELTMNSDNLYGHIDLTKFNGLWNTGVNINFSNNPSLTAITNSPMGLGALNLSLTNYNISSSNIIGNLDMTPISGNISSFIIHNNQNLTGISFNSETIFSDQFVAYQCNIIGNLNLRFTGLTLQLNNNTNLTGITHMPSSRNISTYNISNCNIIGNLDLTPLSGLGGTFSANLNANLTGLTFSPSSNNFNSFRAQFCNLTGNLDLTPLSGIGGIFEINSNSGLTNVMFTPSTNNFTRFFAYNCDLRSLDLSMFSNLGGAFIVSTNLNLTAITHTSTTLKFTSYSASACNLIGNHNISMLQNLGGEINISSNPVLTGITITTGSTESISGFRINSCDIQGGVDLTPFTGFGSTTIANPVSIIKINANSGLTSFVFPESNGLYYRNPSNNILNAAFGMYACSLGYVDFKPLSGSTLISGSTGIGIPRFELFGNGMTTSEVNHILSDFDLISSLNYSGWTSTSGTSGAYVDISGNSAPDGSSGGYDGTGATINLISKGWTIITD